MNRGGLLEQEKLINFFTVLYHKYKHDYSKYMKLYFDTSCWVRITETNLDEILKYEKNQIIKQKKKELIEKERTAVVDILDLQEKNKVKYTIISSKHQIGQLYTKLTSLKTSQRQKEALPAVIAFCIENTDNTTNSDPPNWFQPRNELMQKCVLPDSEDAKHIVIGWIREADYFVTTDKPLYDYNKKCIESTLDSMLHPTLGTHRIEILNPIDCLTKF